MKHRFFISKEPSAGLLRSHVGCEGHVSSQQRACFSSFPPLILVSLLSSSTLLLPFQILIKAHQPRPTGSKTPMQQDYGITQPGSGSVKALCSNQRAAQEAHTGGPQESELEFVRRSDAAQAFCEQRRRFLSASELLKAGSTAKKKKKNDYPCIH